MPKTAQISLFHPHVGRKQSPEHIWKRVLPQKGLHHGRAPVNKLVFTPEQDEILRRVYVEERRALTCVRDLTGISVCALVTRMRDLGLKRRKVSEVLRGKKLSPEHIAKSTRHLYERGPWNKGTKCSDGEKQAMSVRAIAALAKGHPYSQGYHWSEKLQAKVFYRSSYEKKYMEQLDADNDVVWYEYEPKSVTITYEFDGMKRRYRPDFLVRYVNGDKRLVEIKSAWHITFEKTQAKMEALRLFKHQHPEINGCEVVVGSGRKMRSVDRVVNLGG